MGAGEYHHQEPDGALKRLARRLQEQLSTLSARLLATESDVAGLKHAEERLATLQQDMTSVLQRLGRLEDETRRNTQRGMRATVKDD